MTASHRDRIRPC